MQKSESVKDRLLRAAKTEFMEKGFQDASLRQIAKTASLTTGAFYVHFKSKDDLFMQLVSPTVEGLLTYFREYGDKFFKLEFYEQKRLMLESDAQSVEDMLDYIYDNFDLFRIALTKSTGTKYENLIDMFVDIEESVTNRMIHTFRQNGIKVNEISLQSVHILISANFTAFFEPIVHGMEKKAAQKNICEMRKFFNAGWRELLFGD
ncbi:MAG: TetR/AcrR family transcriptional regulator [Clostridia bacterium]